MRDRRLWCCARPEGRTLRGRFSSVFLVFFVFYVLHELLVDGGGRRKCRHQAGGILRWAVCSHLMQGGLNLRINLASKWGSDLICRSSVDPYVPPFE
ncbi:MAG TPA: hypothetical protein DEF45_15405 [Rhodopirellula sp.]|nr:hypothetical protein [Rhodopirellula sp.]